MEHTIAHLAATAIWFFVITFIFAIIGVIATIRWIIGLFFKAGQAVESGVENVERRL